MTKLCQLHCVHGSVELFGIEEDASAWDHCPAPVGGVGGIVTRVHFVDGDQNSVVRGDIVGRLTHPINSDALAAN